MINVRGTAMTTVNRLLANRPLQLLAATLVVAVAGTLTLTAAQAAPPHGGPGGPMMSGRGIEQMLDKVGASADQRTQIQAIMKAAHDDLRGQRDAGRGLHEQMMVLFTQPTVDARAVETLRQQEMAQHDQASKRLTQAMVEASRVLSLDQRKQLGEQMAERRAMMERHRGEREAGDAKAAR
jgi:Spy/CpxP family protein refolding chaperone